MVGKKLCSNILLFFVLMVMQCSAQEKSAMQEKRVDHEAAVVNQEFLESFIKFYDFSTVGRYTHEYHPFLFKKSSYSLDELEKNLNQNGLEVKGRIVITGYEEQAVPTYYSNFRTCLGAKINDEAYVKGKSGWGQQLHNVFGVMTGFLFRDVASINKIGQGENRPTLFEHIHSDAVFLYDDDAYLFQKHAFGDLLELMRGGQEVAESCMVKQDQKKLFSTLIEFWQDLYEHELKFGSRQVLGTQDILFSIAHAQHLRRSQTPLLKYYVGPDITYPIKISSLQHRSATVHAQAFVKEFTQQLMPIEQKKTVYIFCSFVDGVGKSTLLGNVQNYKKYANNFAEYDDTDNSSSQLAALYDYNENVVIADLPAQMSHFTYKPDGFVYFDVRAANNTQQDIATLSSYVVNNKILLQKQMRALTAEVYTEIMEEGYFAAQLNDVNCPEKAFIRNLFLLHKEAASDWIPFVFNGNHYLFHAKDPGAIRVLVPLARADSLGLKNTDPAQMLFLDGLRFPMFYQLFIDDLVTRLKNKGVERVVFVDFLSMYPRSSRENIRVNYLLQQLCLLYPDFNLEKSSYASFVNDAQLLCLVKRDKKKQFPSALYKEALVRSMLYLMMEQAPIRSIDGVSIERITNVINEQDKLLSDRDRQFITRLAHEKIRDEIRALERVHGFSKNYINVQSFEWEDVLAFSQMLQNMFTTIVKNERLQALWLDTGVIEKCDQFGLGLVDKTVQLADGSMVRVLYVIDPECRDEIVLAPVMRAIRTSWYFAIANLLNGKALDLDDEIVVEKERFFVAPLMVKKMANGRIVVFQKAGDLYEKPELAEQVKKRLAQYSNIDALKKCELVKYGEICYLANPWICDDASGLFAFAYTPKKQDSTWPNIDSEVGYMVQKCKKNAKQDDDIITTSQLWDALEDDYFISCEFKTVLKQAQQNAKSTVSKKSRAQEKTNEAKSTKKSLIRLGNQEMIKPCRWAIRAFATLEMILRDPVAAIALQRGDKKDYSAALKLFEKVVLPNYFDLIFEHDLFADYENVLPLISVEPDQIA